MIITKKKLIKKAVEICLFNDTSKARNENEFRYNMGVANGLNALCCRLGINLTEHVIAAKENTDE